jgi:hypothetical protein
MSDPSVRTYVSRSEGMVRPADVATISLFGTFLGKLPKGVQKRIMASSMADAPYMGFVVEPYATFLCFELTDLARAERLVPPAYRIVPTRVFADGEPRPTVIVGAFNVHTSAFWGTRLELYVVAEHRETGLLSWIIVDYATNTLSFDPGQGFVSGNATPCVVTSTHRGTVLVDAETADARVAVEADLRAGVEVPLDDRLWIEGNLSIDYGADLADPDSVPFGIVFDPAEMERALRIPRPSVELHALRWLDGLYDPEPFDVAVFPYAQHFVTTGVPKALGLRTREDLLAAVADLNAAPPERGFESESIWRAMGIGMAVSATITWGAVGYLLVQLLTGS